jgi:hypothetical protein
MRFQCLMADQAGQEAPHPPSTRSPLRSRRPAPHCGRQGRGRGGLSAAGSDRLEPHDPSVRRWLYRGSFTICPSKWHRTDPVLFMSQRTKSHPDASRSGDTTNHPTEGSRKTIAVNAQPRGFITLSVRPMMSPVRDSQIRSTRSIVRAPDSTSSQPRGFIISVPGVHDCRISPSTPCPSPPSARTNSRCSDLRPTPVGTVDRVAKGSALVFAVVDCDIRAGHGASESQTSPAPASGRGSTVASSRRHRAERQGRTASPEDSRSNVPSLGLHSFTGLWKSGSKMGEQVTCFARARWTITYGDRGPAAVGAAPGHCPRGLLVVAALAQRCVR